MPICWIDRRKCVLFTHELLTGRVRVNVSEAAAA